MRTLWHVEQVRAEGQRRYTLEGKLVLSGQLKAHPTQLLRQLFNGAPQFPADIEHPRVV